MIDLSFLCFFYVLAPSLLRSPVSALSSSLKMSGVASEARAKKLYRQTPLIRSDPLSRLTGTPVYLKLDALQNSGSFKDRGMAHLCLELSKTGVTNIISSSGGNAGLAAATVAQQLGLDCKVVVPVTTKQLVVEKLESLGATVQVTGENWNAADAVVQKMVADDTTGKTAYIPPYENPLLWTGHSTVVDEIYQELDDKPSTIIVSVGGGGLLCGVLEGIERLNVKCNVIAAETDGASSFAQAWNSGELVTLASIDSVATSLGALQVSETAIERSKSHESKSLGTVTTAISSDAEAVDACLQFARDHRMLVEPACGAALAVLYSDRLRKNVGEGPLVVEVCGGSGVNLDLLRQWKEMLSL